MGHIHANNDPIKNDRHGLNGDDGNDPADRNEHAGTSGGGGAGAGAGALTVIEQKPSSSSSIIRKLRSPSTSRKGKSSSSSTSSYLCGLACFGTPPTFSSVGGEENGMASLRVPDIVPSPADDCQKLRKAFEGWGTDEKAVIWILGHRNSSQRKKIREAYQQLYNKSLIADLYSELSGDFRKAIIWWTYDPPERDARLAKEALQTRKKGIKHLLPIIEIACASVPQHLIAVRQEYCSLHDCSMEEDIPESLSFPVRKFLVGMVSCFRYDKELVDSELAKSEAALLHEAIEKKQLYHDHVLWILTTRNFSQLRATFAVYKQDYGTSIDEDIRKCGNGDLESLLKVLVCCIDTPEKHFAEVIRIAIVGLGTDEDSLSRAIVTRAEVDMKKVREEYSNMYRVSLDSDVIGDTSGDYKNFLLTLLGSKT
ncbi:hypothetical protein MLD38_008849 [Melastoma candidum]|uniref:Uncharacterized protein n=1 Tax=Melastoma candidum TaxID=119954 RepID=A0ACB9RXL4_9MYRT|nr:hypothetical protein MLD38_008849 [Melastoma candidum]